MQKLENNTLQKFLKNLVRALKYDNEDRRSNDEEEINIPFIISSLYQSFNNSTNKYNDFISNLEKSDDYWFDISDSKNEYDGIIDIDVILAINNHFNYQLQFTYESRDYGYCDCTPDMPDYLEDKHCCGHGCDASFCSFSLHKVLNIVSDSWHGDEHDYWEFEDEFYASDKELADKKAEEDKARMIEELKNRIEADQKKLAELESE